MFLIVCGQPCALPRIPPWKDIQVSTVLNLEHVAYVFPSTSSRAIAETSHIGQSTTSSGKAPTSDSRPGVLTDWDSWCLPSLARLGGRLECPITLRLDGKDHLKLPCFAAEHAIVRTTARVEGESWTTVERKTRTKCVLRVKFRNRVPSSWPCGCPVRLGVPAPAQQILTRLAHQARCDPELRRVAWRPKNRPWGPKTFLTENGSRRTVG